MCCGHDLWLTTNAYHDWAGVGRAFRLTRPDILTGFPVNRKEGSGCFMPDVDVELLAIEQRRERCTTNWHRNTESLARIDTPDNLAGCSIKTGHRPIDTSRVQLALNVHRSATRTLTEASCWENHRVIRSCNLVRPNHFTGRESHRLDPLFFAMPGDSEDFTGGDDWG